PADVLDDSAEKTRENGELHLLAVVYRAPRAGGVVGEKTNRPRPRNDGRNHVPAMPDDARLAVDLHDEGHVHEHDPTAHPRQRLGARLPMMEALLKVDVVLVRGLPGEPRAPGPAQALTRVVVEKQSDSFEADLVPGEFD